MSDIAGDSAVQPLSAMLLVSAPTQNAETSCVNVPSALAMLDILRCLCQRQVHGGILALIQLAATSLIEMLSCSVSLVCD